MTNPFALGAASDRDIVVNHSRINEATFLDGEGPLFKGIGGGCGDTLIRGGRFGRSG